MPKIVIVMAGGGSGGVGGERECDEERRLLSSWSLAEKQATIAHLRNNAMKQR